MFLSPPGDKARPIILANAPFLCKRFHQSVKKQSLTLHRSRDGFRLLYDKRLAATRGEKIP
jgi:hypothetical protein